MVTGVAAASAAGVAVQAASEGWLGAPWTFWAGLVGSGFTAAVAITTLVVSNRAGLRRQAEQQEHDARQKREDRKLAMRREVYVEAVEEAHGLLAAIGGLPQRGLETSGDVDALQAFLKANAKVWLVADGEAAHLSRELATEFSQLFLHAQAASMPVRHALEPARLRTKDIERSEAEVTRLTQKLNDSIAACAPQIEKEKLVELLEEASALVRLFKKDQAVVRAASAPLAFEAFRSTFGEMRAVQRSLCAMVSALRAELGVPGNDKRFLTQLSEMEESAWAAVNLAAGIDPPGPMPDIGG